MKNMKYSLVSFLMMIVILSFSLNVLGKEKVEGYKYFKFGKSYDQIKEDAKENGDRCDKKATMVVRLDSNGKVLLEGEKVLVGGNDIYKTVCRKHFRDLTKLI